ncbi:ice-binding family protein [Nitrosomonas oligotropha]|uniref:ice-binding family protein n=1 Tax=Nitrosomonas oligotropha TaxID=42354 RepID=UPI00136B9831|nr:ice-binding family protein [Nitrosomonas oligotropha]
MSKLRILSVAALAFSSPYALANPILESDLASFAVLGSSTVTNVPISTIIGNIGVWSSGGANAITGFNSSPGVATSDPQVTGGQVHAGTALAESAQNQLTTAISNLNLMGTGTTLISPDLGGLTLTPGVYTVHAGTSNLTGVLTLDGLGNANAAWVFQMDSSLITSVGSAVNLINTGSDAGVFWDVRSSATLGSNTSFEGNILALSSISFGSEVSMGCGGAFASTGAVTMIMDSIEGGGCGGGITVPTHGGTPTFLPFVPVTAVPEPETYTMLIAGLSLIGFMMRRRKNGTA